MRATRVRLIFALSAVYDGVLGAAFLTAHGRIFDWLGITRPNHDAYVQFGASVLLVFAVAFGMVAADPVRNRPLMPVGALFKLAYALPILWHLAFGSIPLAWTWFAWADLVFAVLFFAAWRGMRVA